ncbi:HAMP domain-containing histidine kinase [Occultella glacieicola]|uniref:histidine kinase n=1 Tax=Occultella glacieicola TaxID=2518684 RepID=A0ABY2E0C1_9MICO|nr:HAMP domain-containing sensor histidine kinase [Occultella glacieicola]TDE90858.1 HAMP domain-containing histidine kinase [Occultella glacieicola]
MVTAIVLLATALVAVLVYLALIVRQVRTLTRQLTSRLRGDERTTITLDLINPALEALAVRTDEALRATRDAEVRSHRDELRFRALITDISHDLRTPLTAVRGYQQLLGRSDLDADQRAKLAVAQRHATELETLVQRLYEYSYLLEAEPRIVHEEVDVAILVADVLLAATQSLEDAGLDVRFDPPGPVLVTTDREKLTRIVQNLVRNAAQHGQGHLEVAVVTTGDHVEIRCANPFPPGAAVDPDRLFERFFTADSSRSDRTTGLGLSIVSVLARQLGGCASATLEHRKESPEDRLVLWVAVPRRPAGP